MSNYDDEYRCRRSGILILGHNGMVGKGVKRGAVALVPSASAFVSPAGNERTAMSVEREEGREGGKGEGEERRLLKVGGKFGSAAKLTQLSSPLLKRNFGSPTPALPACLCLPLPAYFSILSLLSLSHRMPSPFLCLSLRFIPVLPYCLGYPCSISIPSMLHE